MRKMLALAFLSLPLAAACGTEEDSAKTLATSAGTWTVYDEPTVTPNPTASIKGSATAIEAGTGMKITLSLTGLPPSKTFGAHLHKAKCDDNKAGGHYQHTAAPTPDKVSEKEFANATNEAWLDFTTDATGAATREVTVAWLPRKGEASAIVVHAMPTDDMGKAGPKLACLGLAF